MKNSDFDALQRGMAEAKAYLDGAREGYIVHEPLDVRQVRARTQLTRQEVRRPVPLDARAVEQWSRGGASPRRGRKCTCGLSTATPTGGGDGGEYSVTPRRALQTDSGTYVRLPLLPANGNETTNQ